MAASKITFISPRRVSARPPHENQRAWRRRNPLRQPDVSVASEQWIVDSHGKLVMTYERFKKLSGLAGLAEIDGLGREGVSGDKKVSGGGAVRTGRSIDRIQCSAASYDADELKRRILLILNMNRIVQHIWRQSASKTRAGCPRCSTASGRL